MKGFKGVRRFGSGFLRGYGNINIKMGHAMKKASPLITMGSIVAGQPEGFLLGQAIGMAGDASISVGEGALALQKGDMQKAGRKMGEIGQTLEGVDQLYS